MGTKWDAIYQKFEDHVSQLPGYPDRLPDVWPSDLRRIREITKKAEKLGLDPTSAEKATLSNLRTIAKECRVAIKTRDRARLEQLFEWAGSMPNLELRLKLQQPTLEEIEFTENYGGDGEKIIEISLSHEQFERIVFNTRSHFAYKLKKTAE